MADTQNLKVRAALLSTLFALGSVAVALSTLLIPVVAIKITVLVGAVLLLAAAGASIAISLARPKLPSDR